MSFEIRIEFSGTTKLYAFQGIQFIPPGWVRDLLTVTKAYINFKMVKNICKIWGNLPIWTCKKQGIIKCNKSNKVYKNIGVPT